MRWSRHPEATRSSRKSRTARSRCCSSRDHRQHDDEERVNRMPRAIEALRHHERLAASATTARALAVARRAWCSRAREQSLRGRRGVRGGRRAPGRPDGRRRPGGRAGAGAPGRRALRADRRVGQQRGRHGLRLLRGGTRRNLPAGDRDEPVESRSGARAVLPLFREQEGGGVLINMSSLWGGCSPRT